jgi:hypothetical protein
MMNGPRVKIKTVERRFMPERRRIVLRRFLAEVSIFILGFLARVLLHFVGDLYITEILLITFLPFLILLGGRRLLRPGIKPIFLLLGLWFVGLLFSDAYRRTEMFNRFRGMALIVFFAAQIAAFAIILIGNERLKVIFITAYAAGSVVIVKLQPTAFSEEHPWKFGYATGINMLVVLVSCSFYARRKFVPAVLCLSAIAGYNLLVNYRSAFLEIMLATVLVLPIIPERLGRIRILPRKRGFAHVLMVCMIALLAGWTANKIVSYATNAGFLGEEAQLKNEGQAASGNLILGGRPEVFTGLRAVADSPIVGYGSWPVNRKYIEMQFDLLAQQGRRVNWYEEVESDSGLIPSHSHLVGAWIFAGILGVPFWAYLVWLVARAIFLVAIQRPPLAPIYCYLFVTVFWDILFSPFGSFERTIEAFVVVIIVDVLDAKITNVTKPSLLMGSRKRFGWIRPSLRRRVPSSPWSLQRKVR